MDEQDGRPHWRVAFPALHPRSAGSCQASTIVPLVWLAMVLPCATAFSATWFVDKGNASGVETGHTWGEAFTTIQPAIDAAFADSGGEVWVAEGVYDEERVSPVDEDAREQAETLVDTGSLVLREGVRVYGGFMRGAGSLADADPGAHPSVIDGSHSRHGTSAYHVVLGADNALLNGFTVTGGKADGGIGTLDQGGGLISLRVSPRVERCAFTRNEAVIGGGLSIISGAESLVRFCTFNENRALAGAGLAFGGGAASLKLEDCRFQRNDGGAVYCVNGMSVSVTRSIFACNIVSPVVQLFGGNFAFRGCRFENNDTSDWERPETILVNGFLAPVQVRLENCVFVGNRAGTAIVYVDGFIDEENPRASATVAVRNCTFAGNEAAGAVIWRGRAAASVRNTILWNHDVSEISPYMVVRYSDVEGGAAGTGNIAEEPQFMDLAAGDVRVRRGSPCVDAGTADDAPADDIRGYGRPLGAGYDMGAYELPAADVDGDGDVDSVDLQLVVNGALSLPTGFVTDVNGDASTDAIDIQLVILAVLGLD